MFIMRLVLIVGFVCKSAFALIDFHNPDVIQEVKRKISTAYEQYTNPAVEKSLNTLQEWQNKIVSNGHGVQLILSNHNLNDNHLNLLKILFIYNQNVTTLDLNSNRFTEFDDTGLESLTNLYLYNNQLTAFDANNLQSLTYLDLSHNQLTAFEATGLESLTHLYLSNNKLTAFEASNLQSLTYLDLSHNQLIAFDPSNLQSLTNLNLSNNQLTAFDANNLQSLTHLDLYNNQLTAFDPSNLTSLKHLDLENNSLTAFDPSNLTSLTNLDLSHNQLTAFDPSNLQSLTNLNLSNNQLTAFDANNLQSLTDLDLYNNQLTAFEATGLESLTYLDLSHNQLIAVDASNLPSLKYLYLENNSLTAFDPSNLASLTYLDLSNNSLTAFDASNLQSLTNLNLSHNRLTAFEATGLESLKDLNLSHNQLIAVDASNLQSLTDLYLSHNRLTEFDASDLQSLIYLNLEHNSLTAFDPSNLASLKYLYLYNNQLTAFDPSNLTSLKHLYLSNNSLTAFDASNLQSLTYLNLENNSLTAFDGSDLQSLIYLHLENNSLTAFEASNLQSLTNLYLSNNLFTRFDGSGLNAIIYFPSFSWAVEANIDNIRFDCAREGLNPVIKKAMINALRESNNPEHQTLGLELLSQYYTTDGAIIQLPEDIFCVDKIKSLAPSFKAITITDAAKQYWIKQISGTLAHEPTINKSLLINHIFVQALQQNPQDNGVFYLPGNVCKSAAIILTGIFEHFQCNNDPEKENECIGRLNDSFSHCQSNQALIIWQEIFLLELAVLPNLTTLEGFVEYSIISFKQECAEEVIKLIRQDDNTSCNGTHGYSKITSILNVLFNTGSNLTDFTETFSSITEDELAFCSRFYVDCFTSKKLLGYFCEQLNQPSNSHMQAIFWLGEQQYKKAVKQFNVMCERQRMSDPNFQGLYVVETTVEYLGEYPAPESIWIECSNIDEYFVVFMKNKTVLETQVLHILQKLGFLQMQG